MFITQQNVSFFHCFPYYEEGRGIFLWKIELYMDPLFSKFIFPKSSRASAHQFWARSDLPVSRKMTFLFKIDHFNKVNCVNYLDIGGCERSPDGANRFGILFTTERWYFYGSIFFLSWKMIIFFLKKWQKGISKKVHFQVNYATFLIHSYS